MSQFVKKSVNQSVVHVSNGSKPSAPYELACVKGVRNTSFVPAEDKDEKTGSKKKPVGKRRPGRGGLLGLAAKDMKDGKVKDSLMEEAKKLSEPVKYGKEDLPFNTYATWARGNPQYKIDIGGGFWGDMYDDDTKKWKKGKKLDKVTTAISDRKASIILQASTKRKWSETELRELFGSKEKTIKPFIGITGGNPDKRTEKLNKLTEKFGKGFFYDLTGREERQWTFNSVRDAMYALTKNKEHSDTFTMIALGSTDLHVIDPNTDNLGKTYRDVGIKGEKTFKPDDYIKSMQTELKAKGKNALVWISGSLSYFIKGINGLRKEDDQINLVAGGVYVTSITELDPGTRKKGVDEAYRYNFAILEQIIGKDFKGGIIIGARK